MFSTRNIFPTISIFPLLCLYLPLILIKVVPVFATHPDYSSAYLAAYLAVPHFLVYAKHISSWYSPQRMHNGLQ